MSELLNLSTRHKFHTLFDTRTLVDVNDDRPAIIYLETGQEPVIVAQSEFQKQVLSYASGLRALGVQSRDLVIIAHVQNLESIYAFWGAMHIGAIPSMFPTLTEKLDHDVYMESMAQLVQHSGVNAILTTDDFAAQLAKITSCPVYGSANLKQETQATPPVIFANIAPDEIAFLQHSSGTTGLKKGIALSHEAVLNQLASYSSALELNGEDVIVSWLPLYHDMGLIAGFILPIMQGIPLVLMSPFDWVKHPAMLFKAIHEYNGTFCWLPNFAYNHCARRIRQRDMEGISLNSMRAFINCSEPVRYDSHTLFVERFGGNGVRWEQLAVSYAMAENTFAVTQTPIGETTTFDIIDPETLAQKRKAVASNSDNALKNVSCGKPIANVAVKVVDESKNSLPERHIGEIAVQSDAMLTEYYKRSDLNEVLLFDGWYLTGDMGYVADGEIYIVGRKKDLIISGGKNIYPQDIEAIVNTVTGVYPGRAVVFGVPDEKEGTELIGIVAETTTDDPGKHAEIKRAIRNAVSQQSTVTANYVTLVDSKWLLKTSSGKIARAANRDKWLAEHVKS